MGNMQPTKTGNESGKQADTSDGLTKSPPRDNMGSAASKSLRSRTTATTQRATKKTWTSAELAELKRKAGLVAGAIADFQAACGLVAVKNVEYEKGKFAVRIFLVAEGMSVKKVHTPDGFDISIEPYLVAGVE